MSVAELETLDELESLFWDERGCDARCVNAARYRFSMWCDFELLLCARHRRQFEGWMGRMCNHKHEIPDGPVEWSRI